jgi:hypothetical protein
VTIRRKSNRRFEFQKRRQLFVRTHNETLSVAAVCVNIEYRSTFVIYRRDAAPTLSGFTEIVGWKT